MSEKRGSERAIDRDADHYLGRRDYVDIRAEFADIEGDEHVALFYEDTTSQLRVAAAFADAAMQAGKKCLYLADDNEVDQIEAALSAAGIDVTGRIEAGALEIADATDVYLEDGFDPEQMIQRLQRAAADCLEAGHAGLAVAGENTWSFETEQEFDEIVDFEMRFEGCCDEIPASTLCQYSLNRFDETAVAKALRTHRYVVYRQRICENPNYVPPEEYATSATPELNASLMLEQAHELATTRRDIETQKQHLAVLNRVLRHNIGNDLNVILGRLSLLEESADLDEGERDHLTTAMQVAERVVDRADKAREVQQTVSSPRLETISLDDAVGQAVREIGKRFARATVTVDHDDVPPVVADRHLETAIRELLTNAIVHQPGETPSVDVSITEPSSGTVRVDVCNEGPPIPETDRKALGQETETPFTHGSGLGLWLVKWIVDNSNGSLSFPGDSDRCRVRIELQADDTITDQN